VQYISEKGHSIEKLLNDGDLRKNRQPRLAYLRASGLKACADEGKVAVKKNNTAAYQPNYQAKQQKQQNANVE